MSQLSHLQVLAAFWMPLALAALHRYLRDPRPRWLAAFAGATTLQGLTNGYYLAYFPVLVGLWAAWFSRGSGGWRQFARIGAAGAAAMLPLAPVLATYRLLHAEQGLTRAASEIAAYSADLTSLAGIAPHLAFWGFLEWSPGPEQELFPGVAIVLLIGVALWRARGWRPGTPEPRRLHVARTVATASACLGGAVLVTRLLAGPWAVDLAGLRVSVTSIDKIGAHFVLAAAAALLLGRTCTAAWRRRSPFAFYLLAAAALGLCAMGPRPEVAGTPVMAYSPYLGLLQIPGFEALRAPARFWMLVLVCLSALAALSCARLAPAGGRRRLAFFAMIAAGILLDGWGRLPVVPSPSPSPLLEARAAGPVADLPLGWRDDDAAAMLRTAAHGRGGRERLQRACPARTTARSRTACGRGAATCSVGWRRSACATCGWTGPDRAQGGWRPPRLPCRGCASTPTRPPRPCTRSSGRPTRRRRPQSARACRSCARGRARTRTWSSTRSTESTDYGGRPVRRLRVSGSDSSSMPRGRWVGWSSGAVSEWTFPAACGWRFRATRASGRPSGRGAPSCLVLRGALRDAHAPLTVTFPAARARYVRLRQTGRDPSFAWSVTEVDVHAPLSGNAPGSPARRNGE